MTYTDKQFRKAEALVMHWKGHYETQKKVCAMNSALQKRVEAALELDSFDRMVLVSQWSALQ